MISNLQNSIIYSVPDIWCHRFEVYITLFFCRAQRILITFDTCYVFYRELLTQSVKPYCSNVCIVLKKNNNNKLNCSRSLKMFCKYNWNLHKMYLKVKRIERIVILTFRRFVDHPKTRWDIDELKCKLDKILKEKNITTVSQSINHYFSMGMLCHSCAERGYCNGQIFFQSILGLI